MKVTFEQAKRINNFNKLRVINIHYIEVNVYNRKIYDSVETFDLASKDKR